MTATQARTRHALAPMEVGRPAGRYAVVVGVWLRAHVRSMVVLSVVLSAVAVVHTSGMITFPVRFDDEGTYVSQAWSFFTRGDLSPYTYWYDHPPFGWMQLAAYFGLTGALDRAANAIAAGREAMLFAHLLSAGLLYVLARRLRLARPWAVLAVVLYSFSPLAMSMHRMVFLDNIAMPWLIGAFVLACTPRHRLAAYAGSALCFAAAVMSKETVLLLLPALLYQVWQNTDRANHTYTWAVFGSVLVLTGVLYPVYALLSGELVPSADRVSLVEAIQFQLTRDGGNAAETMANWLRLDHHLLLLGSLAAVPALAVRRLRPFVLMAVIHAGAVLRPGYLPVPYAVALILPAAVLIAGVLDALSNVRLAAPRLRTVATSLSVIAVLVIAGMAGPSWARGLQTATRYDQDARVRQTQEWLRTNVEPDARLLVDNSLWLDIVRAGFPERNVIWFYKLDLDPTGVGIDFPEGHRSFDYLVASEIVRDSAEDLPEIRTALENSSVVATFGDHEPVEVRRIYPDGVPDAHVSDRQFLVDHFEIFLGREPSAAELTRWLRKLRAGADRAEVMQALADSEEHLARSEER